MWEGVKGQNDPSAVFLSLWTMTGVASPGRHPEDSAWQEIAQNEAGGGNLRRQMVKSKAESWREPQGSVCSLRRATSLSVPTCSAVNKHESVERR